MYNEWMELQKKINEGFQEQIKTLTDLMLVQVEVNRRLQERIEELENFNKKLQEEA